MSHAELEELVAAYAIDALDERADERELVEHIAVCAACRELFRELRETAADLALAAAPRPVAADLERRVLGAVRGEPAPARDRARWPRRTVAGAAAVALVALGVWNAILVGDLGDARREADAVRAAAGILTRPGAAVVGLDGPAGGATLGLAGADGVLIPRGLPGLPAGKVYELWLIGGGSPTPAAVFSAGERFVTFVVLPGVYEAAAVTVEPGPRGGTAPSGREVLAGRLF